MDNNHANNDESKPGNSSDENPKPNADLNVTSDSENSSLSPVSIEPKAPMETESHDQLEFQLGFEPEAQPSVQPQVQPTAQSDAELSVGDLEVKVGDDLVNVIGAKPSIATEILTGDRETMALAKKAVVDDYQSSGQTLSIYAENFNQAEGWKKHGFAEEFLLTRDALWSWVKKSKISLAALADRRHFNRRLRFIVDETAANIIQILRENPRIGTQTLIRVLEERRDDNRPGIKVGKYGSIRLFKLFLLKNKIPARLNAASWGSFHKSFGIRVPHDWSHSNEQWQTDSAEVRISVLSSKGELVRPHFMCVVDCFSSLIMAAELFDHYPTSEDASIVLKRAISAKRSEYNFGGVPEALSFDKHGVFHNSEYPTAPKRLGIVTIPIPRGQSVNNGKVERTFRSYRSMFEDDFPAWLRRSRRIHEDNERFVGDFFTLRREFHTWVCDMQIRIPREDTKLTRYDMWWSNLPEGADPFPDDLAKRVDDAFRLQVKVKVDGSCRVDYDSKQYSSKALSNLQGRQITLLVELDSSDPSIRAVFRGQDLGELTRTAKGCNLANEVNSTNLAALEDAYQAGKALDENVGAKKTLYPKQNKVRRGRRAAADFNWDNVELYTEEV